MDKKFIIENNLAGTYSDFHRILRGSYVGGLILEADMPTDDENEMQGVANQQNDPMANADPNAMVGGPNPDPSMGDPMMGEDPNMGDTETMQPGDTVIDVDDITNAEEKVNNNINKVGRELSQVEKKMNDLIGALGKIDKYIDRNNTKIENLRNEIEKRNPTPTEKLNMRSLDSYPFNVNPNDFWKQKASQNQNYEIYSDNSESNDGNRSFVLTIDDIDKTSPDEIVKSFNDFDEEEYKH